MEIPIYRVRLTLSSPIATPLHSGTLFGHLCWAMYYESGAAALQTWLATLIEQPLLISDAFPADKLPRPLLMPTVRPLNVQEKTRAAFRETMEQDKKLRKTTWITIDDFLSLRNELTEMRLMESLREKERRNEKLQKVHTKHAQLSTSQPPPIKVRQAHNVINRLTGTTPESGGLYFMNETWYNPDAKSNAAQFDVYVQSTLGLAKLCALFNRIGQFGFGRDANLGRGQFTARIELADKQLFHAKGNRLMSLSHGTITSNMHDARYKLHVHYGKIGGFYAGGVRSPFKYPLLLARPGMTFSPTNKGPFGELLTAVHPHHPEICQNAWHLCVPYTEIESSSPKRPDSRTKPNLKTKPNFKRK